jgi:Arc/MetJ family transcription regulator
MSKKTFGEIHNLVSNGDVVAAETEARGWLLARPEDPAVLGNVGGIFIDIGNYTENTALVREGVDLTRRARVLKPSDRLSYNLANGLLELLPSTPESYVTVSFNPDMAEVCSLYYEAIDGSAPAMPEPIFNFASALLRAGRAVEALDLVRETLALHPQHGRGWTTLGDVLWGVWLFYGRYPDLLQDAISAYRLALTYETVDQPFRDRTEQQIQRAREHLDEVRVQPHPELRDAERTPNSLHADADPWDESLPAFIWKSGLGLNLCSGCRVDSPTAYDRYPLHGILVDPKAKSAAELEPAEVNVLLQGFTGARSLLWLSRAQAASQVEVVSWPVDGLAFSRRAGFLAAAFREAYGVLDRIAELLNMRLGIGIEEPCFDKLFFEKKNKQLIFRSTAPWPESVGLRALMYLSASFERDRGRFKELRSLRNDLQHSLVLSGTLHAEKKWPWRAITDDDLEKETFRMLRLTRSAIIYCCESLRAMEWERLKQVRARGEIVLSGARNEVERA